MWRAAGVTATAGLLGLASTATAAPSVIYGNDDDNTCPEGYARILSEAACRAAMPFLEGGDPDHYNGKLSEADWPKGCYSCNSDATGCEEGVWFNPHASGGAQTGAQPLCQKDFEVEEGRIVFVGDSDVDYWHSSGEAVPNSYNVGIGGQTCGDVIKEIEFILEAFKPKQVVLVCGENDLAGDTSVADTFSRWKSVVETIGASGASIVFFGTKPEADSTDLYSEYKAYDKKIREYVREKAQNPSARLLTSTRRMTSAGCGLPPPVTFVDTFPALLALGNSDSLYDPDEAPDYLHLGPEGYALWDSWVQLALSNTGCLIWQGDTCSEQAPSCSEESMPPSQELAMAEGAQSDAVTDLWGVVSSARSVMAGSPQIKGGPGALGTSVALAMAAVAAGFAVVAAARHRSRAASDCDPALLTSAESKDLEDAVVGE